MATDLGENKRDTRISVFCQQASLLSLHSSPASPADSSADCKLRPLAKKKKKKNKFNWLSLPVFVLTLPVRISHVTCFQIINVYFLEREREFGVACSCGFFFFFSLSFSVDRSEHAVRKAWTLK